MTYTRALKLLANEGWHVVRCKATHVRLENIYTGERTTVKLVEGSIDRRKQENLARQFKIDFPKSRYQVH